MNLRGSVALVGMGETQVGSLPERGSTEICAEAARLALADAGIGKDRIDGLVTCNPWVEPPFSYPTFNLSTAINDGSTPRYRHDLVTSTFMGDDG